MKIKILWALYWFLWHFVDLCGEGPVLYGFYTKYPKPSEIKNEEIKEKMKLLIENCDKDS